MARSSSSALDAKLQRALDERRRVGTLRELQLPPPDCVDFYSNDYLGFARSAELHQRVEERKAALASERMLGATGSRLISGNSRLFTQVERELATFYNSEAALLFNSGYAANLGVLASVPQADDVVLYDALVHNSCHEGMRLSRAYANGHAYSFQHNDVSAVAALLAVHCGPNDSKRCVFVVVESLYSMDGDVAPLVELADLCERTGAFLIVDEAHSTGVYGPRGAGLVSALGLDARPNVVACRVHTFGKAMGVHGAVVCGSQVFVDYLVNYARAFVYTTAMPFEQLVAVQVVHEFCRDAGALREQVMALVQLFKRCIYTSTHIPATALLASDSPIQSVVFAGNHAVLSATRELQKLGVRVVPIRSPTVPKGAERFRIVIHADNTEQEIVALVAALDEMFAMRSSANLRIATAKL